eukprot:3925574-Pleurochrysis_carterae.AAC.1
MECDFLDNQGLGAPTYARTHTRTTPHSKPRWARRRAKQPRGKYCWQGRATHIGDTICSVQDPLPSSQYADTHSVEVKERLQHLCERQYALSARQSVVALWLDLKMTSIDPALGDWLCPNPGCGNWN